jgi:1-acyl-sn-glycerol-3-phosphate acyltransferase
MKSSPRPANRSVENGFVNFHHFSLIHLFRPALRVALHPFFRMEYSGVENVPRTGPVLLVANHVAYADPFWIGLPIARPIHFMTWSNVFHVSYLRPLLKYFLCFPIEQKKAVDKAAFRHSQQIIRNGEALMIFPEGGRTPTGRLEEFKPGAFHIAVKTETPVVPVSLNGAYEAWPRHERFPRPGKITVHFHPPLVFSAGDRDLRDVAAEASETVRAIIASRLASHCGALSNNNDAKRISESSAS